MAVLNAMGLLLDDQTFVHESLTGALFRGRAVRRTMVGDLPALVPEVAALRTADRENDAEAQVGHTVAFHHKLVMASGNSVLLHTWESLGIEIWTALSIRWLGTRQRSYAEEHQELIDAFLRRDPRIGELVKEHVLNCAPRA